MTEHSNSRDNRTPRNKYGWIKYLHVDGKNKTYTPFTAKEENTDYLLVSYSDYNQFYKEIERKNYKTIRVFDLVRREA